MSITVTILLVVGATVLFTLFVVLTLPGRDGLIWLDMEIQIAAAKKRATNDDILLTVNAEQCEEALHGFEVLQQRGFVADANLCLFMLSLVELRHGSFITVWKEQIDSVAEFALLARIEWLMEDMDMCGVSEKAVA